MPLWRLQGFFEYQKSPIRLIMKSDQTIIRKYLMEQINNTTELIGIKDNNITIILPFKRLLMVAATVKSTLN